MNKLRIIPLGGGPGMVTNNLYVYEWGNEVLIVDCGIGFPEDKVSDDILIPDITYLKKNPKKILGIVLTHAHDDHHAALGYLLPELGMPPVFGSRLTIGFATDRLKDFKLHHPLHVLKESDQLKLGPFTIEPIHLTHSVPNTYHLFIKTPVGNIYHGSDFKFDFTPLDRQPPNFKKIIKLSEAGVLCLLSDCLRSERPGFTPSESSLAAAIEREISRCQGRVIFTTMSSQIHRLQQAIDLAVAFGRKIVFIGRSMENNVTTARKLGFLHYRQKDVVNKRQLKRLPDRRLCLIISGSQGQESSSLTRYAHQTHSLIKPKVTDTVIYSTDIIPGNEQAVYSVVDNLAKLGVSVAYQDNIEDLHVSGHASASELQLLMQLVRAHYLYPIGGSFRHMRQYQRLAVEIGYRPEQLIFPDSGQAVEFNSQGYFKLAETLDLNPPRFSQTGVKTV